MYVMSHIFITFIDIYEVRPLLPFPLYFSILLHSLPQNVHMAFAKISSISVRILPDEVALGYLFCYTG